MLQLGVFPLAHAEPISNRETITPEHFRAIQAALPELEARQLDLSRYRVVVWDEGSSIIVLFLDRTITDEQWAQIRGSPPPPAARSFGVEISRDDYRVLKANFQR